MGKIAKKVSRDKSAKNSRKRLKRSLKLMKEKELWHESWSPRSISNARFQQFYDRHEHDCYKYVQLVVSRTFGKGHEYLCDEVHNDSMLEIWQWIASRSEQGRDGLPTDEHLLCVFKRVARRIAWRIQRQKLKHPVRSLSRDPELKGTVDSLQVGGNPEAAVDDHEFFTEIVRKAFAALGQDERWVIAAFLWREKDKTSVYERMAEELGTTVAAIRGLRRRGKAKLQTFIRNHCSSVDVTINQQLLNNLHPEDITVDRFELVCRSVKRPVLNRKTDPLKVAVEQWMNGLPPIPMPIDPIDYLYFWSELGVGD